MRLYKAPEGPAQSIHHAFARIYLRNSPNGGVYKVTLYGNTTDIILAASAMVEGYIGLRAVVVDANTTHGVTARRIMKSGQMTHRR